MADFLTTLAFILSIMVIAQRWKKSRDLKFRQEKRSRLAVFKGEAFAHHYRMRKWVYREILDIRGDKL